MVSELRSKVRLTRLSKNAPMAEKLRRKQHLPALGGEVLDENEVLLLKRRLNTGKLTQDDIFGKDWDKEYLLSPDQNKKGYDWVYDQYKTPAGKERKNNPLGYREQEVVENFSHFTLDSFQDTAFGYSGVHFYVPVYRMHSKDGKSFSYYVSGGEMKIIG